MCKYVNFLLSGRVLKGLTKDGIGTELRKMIAPNGVFLKVLNFACFYSVTQNH